MPTGTEEEYKEVYGKWHDALSKTSPPMVFSESAPAYFAEADNLTDWYAVMDWVPKFGQLARHSRDTLVFNSTLCWPDITGWGSIIFNYGQEVRLARYQRPGYFNDPDFLNVDHFDYTLDEKKTHFALWSTLSAPLIISAWIPEFSAEEIEHLTNKDIIEADQDILALQATLVSQDGTWDVLTKNLANGDRLLTVVNRVSVSASYSVPFEQIRLPLLPFVKVKDLWTGKTSIAVQKVAAGNVPSHGTAVLRLSGLGGSRVVTPTGMIFNTYSLNVLTLDQGGIHWANSTGDRGQVWQTRSDGSLRPLPSPQNCLTDLGGNVDFEICLGKKEQKWAYQITGSIVNRGSNKCLTTGDKGVVTTAKCLYEDNSQVFALPSGVTIIQD
jgi:alpha-galactosidase